MPALRLLFIGESLVLAGAIERARSRGHQIVGVFAAAATEAAAMARAGLPVHGPQADVVAFIAAHPCDVLFSIVNGHLLTEQSLASPRLAAVNYHNAPLPTYAGMWATAWAVLNGEHSHGVTWHRIAKGIDTGAVLAQRRFPLAADETTATLNLRCTEAALESLDEVFERLEAGNFAGQPQDLTKRTYHRRSDTAPNGGLIDWQWPVDHILRLVRACDWGAWRNDFGCASIELPDGALAIVRSAKRITGQDRPGRVVASEGKVLAVACADGVVQFELQRSTYVAVGQSLLRDGAESSAQVATQSRPIPALSQFNSDFNSESESESESDSDARASPSVIECLTALARSNPEALAIEASAASISRGELAARADGVARKLLRHGIKPEDGVGILIHSGIDFVVAALAAMRAGGAYVPLDPSAPGARLRFEIAEAGVTQLLTTANSSHRAEDFPDTSFLRVDESFESDGVEVPLPDIPLTRCAYRIFTSGSSGRPKAVEITHAALANLLAHYRMALPMGPSDRMTMLAHPTFDASVADIWPILAAGGRLLVPPSNLLLDPAGLLQWLVTSRATLTFVPTAVAERMLGLSWPSDVALRALLTGGDVLHRRPPAGLPFRLINTYGPTENTVDSLWAVVEPGTGTPTIGRPTFGVVASVVDATRNPVAAGEIGELVLSGAQVARGYRGRADLNARQFERIDADAADSADADAGDDAGKDTRPCRYYTGDLVRINAQGEFEFHGRIDQQIQIRGVRVEPGEVEALLKADPRVREAVCVPIHSEQEIIGISAHLVLMPEVAIDPMLEDALTAFLAEQLPAVMVPKSIEFHSELPRNAAGKIDRHALQDRQATVAQNDSAEDAARDPILACWRQILRGTPDDDESKRFWDLGGDSLAVVELLLGIESATGVRLPIGLFLADPTLGGLRREIALRRNPVVTRLASGKGPPVILWYSATGDLECYQHLIPLLGEREVLGVMSPALFDLERAHDRLEDAVAFALSSIRQFGVFESPALLGYSWAGLLAFEAARQLAQEQTPAQFVGLIGTLPPALPKSRSQRLLDSVRWTFSRGRAALLDACFDRPALMKRLRRRLDEQRKTVTISTIHFEMAYAYQPSVEPAVTMCLYREQIGQSFNRRYKDFEKPDFGWSHWLGSSPQVKSIDTDHYGMMKGDGVVRLAEMIVEDLDKLG